MYRLGASGVGFERVRGPPGGTAAGLRRFVCAPAGADGMSASATTPAASASVLIQDQIVRTIQTECRFGINPSSAPAGSELAVLEAVATDRHVAPVALLVARTVVEHPPAIGVRAHLEPRPAPVLLGAADYQEEVEQAVADRVGARARDPERAAIGHGQSRAVFGRERTQRLEVLRANPAADAIAVAVAVAAAIAIAIASAIAVVVATAIATAISLEQAAKAITDLAGDGDFGGAHGPVRTDQAGIDLPVARQLGVCEAVDASLEIDRVEKRLHPKQRHRGGLGLVGVRIPGGQIGHESILAIVTNKIS